MLKRTDSLIITVTVKAFSMSVTLSKIKD